MTAPDASFTIRLRLALVAVALLGLACGTAAHFYGEPDWARWLWQAGTVPVLAALLAEIAVSLFHREVGLDIVAALSMSAALAFGERLPAMSWR